MMSAESIHSAPAPEPLQPPALERELRRRAYHIRLCRRIERLMRVGVIALAILMMYRAAVRDTAGPFGMLMYALAFGTSWLFGGLLRRSAKVLADVGDISAIPTLVDALGTVDAETRNIAATSLLSLLPRLTASDAALLSHAHRATLNGVLKRCARPHIKSDPELARAVLAAWEQLGDAAAVPVVEALARSNRFPRLAKRAAECLPALTARVELDAVRNRLLRPAEEAPAAADILLLRAAATGDAADAAALLRPGAAPQDD